MVSLYYHYMYHPSKIVDRLGTFEEFASDFMAGRVAYGPYFNHLYSYWVHRHDSNVLLLSYEMLLQVRMHTDIICIYSLFKPSSGPF